MSTAAYLTLGLAVGAGATALTFRLNAVYGEHGLMKKSRPLPAPPPHCLAPERDDDASH